MSGKEKHAATYWLGISIGLPAEGNGCGKEKGVAAAGDLCGLSIAGDTA